MTISFSLTLEMEQQLRASAATGDRDAVRRLLTDALEPIVQSLLLPEPSAQSVEEFDALMKELDELPDTLTAPPLSDYAVSREGIYEDHP